VKINGRAVSLSILIYFVETSADLPTYINSSREAH
jgi:hypothetical protein